MCFLGVLMGQMVGVLPGIGPAAAIALLLPLTFGTDPTSAIILFAGIYYGSQYGGTLTSVLVSVPGESSTVMTSIDGYQMALQGRAGRARYRGDRLVHRRHARHARPDAARAGARQGRARIRPAGILRARGARPHGARGRRLRRGQGPGGRSRGPPHGHHRHRPAERHRALRLRPELAARRHRVHRAHGGAVRRRRGGGELRARRGAAGGRREERDADARRLARLAPADPARHGIGFVVGVLPRSAPPSPPPRLHRRKEDREGSFAVRQGAIEGVAGAEAANNRRRRRRHGCRCSPRSACRLGSHCDHPGGADHVRIPPGLVFHEEMLDPGWV